MASNAQSVPENTIGHKPLQVRQPSRNALGDLSNKAPVLGNQKQLVNKPPVRVHGSQALVGKPGKPIPFVAQSVVAPVVAAQLVAPRMPIRQAPPVVSDVDRVLEAEVEQLSLAEEPLEDIVIMLPDDAKLVKDYMTDIMAHFREREVLFAPSPTYMNGQADITTRMREILVDWLVQVHQKFRLHSETLFLTISVLDRFLERRLVKKSVLQLVGCAAMFAASKYEEVWAPNLKDFVKVCDYAYEESKFLKMEAIILNTLDFSLTVPTALRFGQRFMKLLVSTDVQKNTVQYLLELTLQDYKFLKYLPSLIAASANYIARAVTKCANPWPQQLSNGTRYSENALQSCVHDLKLLAIHAQCTCQGSCACKYRTVRNKYGREKYNAVSLQNFSSI